MNEILAHPWINGDVNTEKQILLDFAERNEKVQSTIEAEKQAKAAEKQKRILNRDKTMRGSNAEEGKFDDVLLPPPKKAIEDYESLFAHTTEFFSTYHPDMIETALHNHIR